MSELKVASTKVFVTGLKLEVEIGVYSHERGRTQPLLVDVELDVDVAGAVQPRTQTALGQGRLLLRGTTMSLGRLFRQRPVTHPGTQRVMMGSRINLGEVTELVVTGRDCRRLHDPAVLVDPHGARNVGDAKALSGNVGRVHDHRVGGIGRLDPRPRLLR